MEGLRALAILLVVAAHTGIPHLTGGFVGVDVFFVLYGYLITGLLQREIDSEGHLSFGHFYARRFRRLLPALALMLVIVGFASAMLLPPSSQIVQATAAASAAIWLSNIYFAFSDLNYFSSDATHNLFLHTWSLGVEEQFYLIWPPLLSFILLRKKGPGSLRNATIAMTLIVGLGFLASLWLGQYKPHMTFYMMPLRAWQFATGGLTWLLFGSAKTKDPQAKQFVPRVGSSAGWLGLTLIFASAILYSKDSTYPGWRALLPTFGTALIIYAGTQLNSSYVSRWLAARPLQRIGEISYSWYLWHWPCLLLGAVLTTNYGLPQRLLAVATSLVIATAAYRWVELPIRKQQRWISRPGRAVLASIGAMIIVNLLAIHWANTASHWLQRPKQLRYVAAQRDSPVIYAMGCDDWYQDSKVKPCLFGPRVTSHTIVLMGDSIGAQWFPAVATAFDRPGWRLVVLTKSSCPMVDAPFFYTRIGRDYTECTIWRRNALAEVAALHPDILILGSVQTANFTHRQWVDGTASVLKAVAPSTGHIYLIRATPHLRFDGPECLASKNWLSVPGASNSACEAPAKDLDDEQIFAWLKAAADRFANVSTLDMNDLVCPHGRCAAERSGMVIFRDSQHLTASFAETLASDLAERMKSSRGSRSSPQDRTRASTPGGPN